MYTSEISSEHDRILELVATASRLVGKEGVTAIHIALPERPTYSDLRYYRELAETKGFALIVTNSALILRLKQTFPQMAGQEVPGQPAGLMEPERLSEGTSRGSVNRVKSGVLSFQNHISAWNAGNREGTR